MRFQELQHKNLIVSAMVALTAVSLTFYLTRGEELFSSEKTLIVQALPEVKTGAEDIDTDLDGLPDWKEKLYGSNPYVVDSDEDGTRDGDEIRVGRNPAVPNTAMSGEAVNDKLAYLEDPDIATSSTDLLGIKKEFFARYLAEGSKEVKETTFRDLIQKVDVKAFVPRHELLDLTISSDNSTEGVRAYVNAFGLIIKKYLNHRMKESEDQLIKAALTRSDKGTIEELQLLSIDYKNFAADLLALEVPSALARAHLLTVNGYEGMGRGILGITRAHEDPLYAAAAYEAYLKYRLDVVNGYAFVVVYVGNEGITFTKDEPGYPFYVNTVPQQ